MEQKKISRITQKNSEPNKTGQRSTVNIASPRPVVKKIDDVPDNQPIKSRISRRKIPRPEPHETYFWLNTICFSFIILSFITTYLLQKLFVQISNNVIYSGLFAIFFMSFASSVALYARFRLKASIIYRDGMIKRILRDLHIRTMDTDNHGRRLKHLIESTNVCPWSADLKNNCFTYIGPQISAITGIDNDIWTGAGFLLEHAVPSDRKILLAGFKELRGGGFTTVEYRVRSRDGKILWIRNSFCEAEHASNDSDGNKRSNNKYVQGFITDITEQKNVEEALHIAKYAAEKASKTKSNFLASMSHELRTPLNSIIGFSDIMRSEAFGKIGEQYLEYSDNIYSSGKHLLDLINDILDFSKIEAGKFDVLKEPYDLRDIFRSCEMLLRERAVRSELALKILMPPEPLMIVVDGKRIKQVLINILTNSIKFTTSGGSVALEYDIDDNSQLILQVKDTGIGIKPEDIDHVFEKFHQVDAEKNRDQEGTGLGLSISKSLVEMHDGEFSIHSIYGHGTTVTVTFPKTIFYIPKKQNNEIDAEITRKLQNSSFAKKNYNN